MSSTFDGLTKFIEERESVRLKKEAGRPRPWTQDRILHTYRFCNINRNDDTVTKWIHENIIGQHPGSPFLWFMLVVSRVFNNVATLERIPWPSPVPWFQPAYDAVRRMELMKMRVFNPAYIVSTNGREMKKLDYVFEHIFRPLEKQLLLGRNWKCENAFTCQAWFDFLTGFNGLGDFMANQIITDAKYSRYLPKDKTPDWTMFCAAGPGTQRGLNRLFRGRADNRAPKTQMCREIERLQVQLLLTFRHNPYLCETFSDPNNVTNSLCEFDKYERTRLKEGKPKQIYTPGGVK